MRSRLLDTAQIGLQRGEVDAERIFLGLDELMGLDIGAEV
jgi:hypothetical protein